MNHRNELTTALTMLLALGVPDVATAQGTKRELDQFFASNYQYCDAKVLGAMWKNSITESKARIGRKIGWGDIGILNDMLNTARGQADRDRRRACTFDEAGYSYDDAVKLARVWKISVWDAKVGIESLVVRGQDSEVRRLLGRRN